MELYFRIAFRAWWADEWCVKLAILILALAGVALALAVDLSSRTNDSAIGYNFITKQDTNQIQLKIVNRVKPPATTNFYAFRGMDYTATNVLIECSHEPVLLGKSNGVWWIIFK